MALDIGPETVRLFTAALAGAKTVFWNGPLGLFEQPPFDAGTIAIAQALPGNGATTVIGGGDTGADCVGTSNRQGATSVTQIELLPEPPRERQADNPWPTWPNILRTSSSHEEGCQREWAVLTKEFLGDNGQVRALRVGRLKWSEPDETGRQHFEEIPGSDFEIKADLVLLAMGFVHVEHGPLVQKFDLPLDERGNIVIDDNYMTGVPGVFAGGDSVMGASLVVRAIYQGRELADSVHEYLMGS